MANRCASFLVKQSRPPSMRAIRPHPRTELIKSPLKELLRKVIISTFDRCMGSLVVFFLSLSPLATLALLGSFADALGIMKSTFALKEFLKPTATKFAVSGSGSERYETNSSVCDRFNTKHCFASLLFLHETGSVSTLAVHYYLYFMRYQ